jgi:16S rRNA (guanine527-N7)-methyltransferase
METSLRKLLATGASRMGVELDQVALERFSTYLELLQRWGKKINLTARLAAEEVIVYHFLDSLAGFSVVAGIAHGRMIDLGAGAGLPSLPLKFALPGLRLRLIESVRKKVAFCKEVIRATGVADAEALWGRGEDLGFHPEHHRSYDWAVSRALGRSAEVIKMALPFLAPGGRVILYKGEPAPEELEELDLLCENLGASWRSQPVVVPHLAAVRSLIVFSNSTRAAASDSDSRPNS